MRENSEKKKKEVKFRNSGGTIKSNDRNGKRREKGRKLF